MNESELDIKDKIKYLSLTIFFGLGMFLWGTIVERKMISGIITGSQYQVEVLSYSHYFRSEPRKNRKTYHLHEATRKEKVLVLASKETLSNGSTVSCRLYQNVCFENTWVKAIPYLGSRQKAQIYVGFITVI